MIREPGHPSSDASAQGTSLAPAERTHLVAMGVTVGALHVVGWGVLILLVVPLHLRAGPTAFGIGLGVTAYTLGLRHAFDADHIAAIDNATRKLMSEGKRPLSVGFWFSLGHSTIVFLLALLISVGIRALDGPVRDQASGLHQVTAWIGTLVSGSFLLVIAALNVGSLLSVARIFLAMRHGDWDEREFERRLQSRGFMNRFLGPLAARIRTPGQMYPLGLLFGLGFDTATEVALLVVAGGAGAARLPWYAILCLPVLFAAGMTLLDTIDGSFMNFAYGWAFSEPVRKVFYNLAITSLSIAVAVTVGIIELGGLAARNLNLSGSFWTWFENINVNMLGFVLVAMFLIAWMLALAAWRFGRIELRWSASHPPPE